MRDEQQYSTVRDEQQYSTVRDAQCSDDDDEMEDSIDLSHAQSLDAAITHELTVNVRPGSTTPVSPGPPQFGMYSLPISPRLASKRRDSNFKSSTRGADSKPVLISSPYMTNLRTLECSLSVFGDIVKHCKIAQGPIEPMPIAISDLLLLVNFVIGARILKPFVDIVASRNTTFTNLRTGTFQSDFANSITPLQLCDMIDAVTSISSTQFFMVKIGTSDERVCFGYGTGITQEQRAHCFSDHVASDLKTLLVSLGGHAIQAMQCDRIPQHPRVHLEFLQELAHHLAL